jgi:hypothetical protein
MGIYTPRNGELMAPVSMGILAHLTGHMARMDDPTCRALMAQFFCAAYFKPCTIIPAGAGTMAEPQVFPRLLCKEICIEASLCWSHIQELTNAYGARDPDCNGVIAGEEYNMYEAIIFEGAEASLSLLRGAEIYPEGQFDFSSEDGVVTAECFTYDHEAEALQNTLSDLVDWSCAKRGGQCTCTVRAALSEFYVHDRGILHNALSFYPFWVCGLLRQCVSSADEAFEQCLFCQDWQC